MENPFGGSYLAIILVLAILLAVLAAVLLVILVLISVLIFHNCIPPLFDTALPRYYYAHDFRIYP